MSGKVYVPLFQIIINQMPAVTRVGDADVAHCSGMSRAQGSGNVFANCKPISRQGDKNTTHLKPGNPCPPHSASISSGDLLTFQGNQIISLESAVTVGIATGDTLQFLSLIHI